MLPAVYRLNGSASPGIWRRCLRRQRLLRLRVRQFTVYARNLAVNRLTCLQMEKFELRFT